VRGLNEHPHQIAFPLALRPALGIRVEHVEILIVVDGLFHASPSLRDRFHSLEARAAGFLAGVRQAQAIMVAGCPMDTLPEAAICSKDAPPGDPHACRHEPSASFTAHGAVSERYQLRRSRSLLGQGGWLV